ncbi:MAG: LysR family transcriptional regulator [Gammaproteobacteria bacterium]|nr:LysR family transcriptional regulator [Gammaproteobacteria bacterium]MBU1443539.1 LysR family transcriptional regulator [Gammaproteobacteria bacterium]MBU2288757.1 LysR family transcriptional regulator [Gammaproteobacteria bacterium]MBU2408231.1 LysR family transcriptional regulator [Gammaproteobacteria bacterium]
MNITFRQLRVFTEIARVGSMTQAAANLHLTPPAVSMQIKELESQVGLRLFDRHGRELSLSTAGEYFLVHARRLLAQLTEADNAMARLKRLEHGTLTIGLVSTAKYFVPRLLARFHAEHAGVEVKLKVVGNREQLVALMEAGEVDMSIMGRPPKEVSSRAEGFAAHPLVFVCPPSHPLLASGRPAVAELEHYPFIVREPGSGTRSAMEIFFAERHFAPRIAMEMSSNETIKQAVMAGMGLSFLSLHTIGLELRSGLLHVLEVEGSPVMRMWHVVRLQSKVLSPAAEAFRYFVIEHGEAHLREQNAPFLLAADQPSDR